MRTIASVTRRYPLIFATLLIGVAVAVLLVMEQPVIAQWVATLFVSAVVLWTGIGMVRDIIRGHYGLDILAVVAMVAALAVGEYVAAMIIVLMLSGGEALEDFAARRAKGELTALLQRSPQHAHVVLDPDDLTSEQVRDAPVDEVSVGNVLLIRPAEIVPIDGELLSDSASIDESSITGESLPVTRLRGEEIVSGITNGSEAIRIRTLRPSSESQYQRIVALVEQAQTRKAPVERVADRFAVPFTAVSLAIGGLAWWLSGEPTRFAEVLVLATPCPLLIAAPVAFLGGLSRAAKAGVIVKGGAALEQLAKVRSVAFDKTGTLTEGRPDLIECRAEPGFTTDEVLRLAASAEQYSTHVLAEGIRRAATERNLTVLRAESANEQATNGVTASIEGRTVVVGKPAFVAAVAPGARRATLQPGELAAYVAIDGKFAGTLVLADDPRRESAAVVNWLRQEGVERIAMLTGDAKATAETVAATLGIIEVHSELLPEDKVELAAAMLPRPVMMVGDGVNDAPVLAAADIGVAMGAKGATAAGDAADAVILRDSLVRVVDAIDIGKNTLRVALTAIWIGMVLSVGLMLVATTGAIPAVAGALTQELVDLATILYALRALSGGYGRTGDRLLAGLATQRATLPA